MELLYKSKPSVRKVIVSKAGPDFINALCELALNILNGNVPLTTKQYKKLNKKKSVIRLVADKKVKVFKKKKVLNQHGGFLVPLLAAALPFISSFFTRG